MVHVFVEQRQAEKVQRSVGRISVGQQGQRALKLLVEISTRLLRVGQRQRPAAGVGDAARVVKAVGIAANRRPARRCGVGPVPVLALGVARQPVLLKPADVPQLPQWWIDIAVVGDAQALIGQGRGITIESGEGVVATRVQGVGQGGGVGMTVRKACGAVWVHGL